MGTENAGNTYYPNMDIMRYVLSLAVIIAHINVLAGSDLPFPISSFEAVGGFFALSGFLMYPNYLRHNNFFKYTGQRARRILPPYLFIGVLCAFALVLVSSEAAIQYFLSRKWWKYLIANSLFLNWIEPALPGVFSGAEYFEPAVNGSLWTMKVEWCLYFSVPLFVWCLQRFRINRQYFSLFIIIASIIYRIAFTYLYDVTQNAIFEILARQIFGQLAYFYCGMFIFFNKDLFQRHYIALFFVGVALYFVSGINSVTQCLFNPAAIAALVLSVCFIPFNLNFLQRFTNISYEMYLFHFPIIQLSVMFGVNRCGAVAELVCVAAATVLLAALWSLLYRRLTKKT